MNEAIYHHTPVVVERVMEKLGLNKPKEGKDADSANKQRG